MQHAELGSAPAQEQQRQQQKGVYIKTYGCQMNLYDSQRMRDALLMQGYKAVDSPEAADLVILNTCHIRDKAAEKVYSELGRLKKLKDARAEAGERLLLGVAGCVAQAEGDAMLSRAPQLDLVFGPQTYHRLPRLLTELEQGAPSRVDTDFPLESKFDHLPEESKAPAELAAFLTVQEGCDKFCTFCVVPYTRGSEVSRPVRDLVAEARRLVARGVKEITLLGQNVNAFHGEGLSGQSTGLGELLFILAEIDGLERLRFTTSHPRDMDEGLYRAFRDLPQLMPYLHLPVQAGSDRVLRAMNRRHSAEDYRRAVDKLREARPDVALSGDFIVGFPGESDSDFADTLKLVTEVGYAQAYSFKYSPRPGTPAATLGAQVPETVKAERLESLQQLLSAQQLSFNQASRGRSLPVLIEREGRLPGQFVGRSPYMQAVHIDTSAQKLGEIVEVEIVEAGPRSLSGRLRSGADPQPNRQKTAAA